MTSSDANRGLEALVSYSHADDRYRQQLDTHLSLLQHQGLLTLWHDRKIGAGMEWETQIDAHLDSADLFLLLISPNFLASKYCYGVELKRVLERHEAGTARVIPIIVRPVDWHSALFAKLQALPTDGRPISTWSNKDKGWLNVVEGIRRTIGELRARVQTRQPALTPEQEQRRGRVYKGLAILRQHGEVYERIRVAVERGDYSAAKDLAGALNVRRRAGIDRSWAMNWAGAQGPSLQRAFAAWWAADDALSRSWVRHIDDPSWGQHEVEAATRNLNEALHQCETAAGEYITGT